MPLNDYTHHNEESLVVWWAEEGRHHDDDLAAHRADLEDSAAELFDDDDDHNEESLVVWFEVLPSRWQAARAVLESAAATFDSSGAWAAAVLELIDGHDDLDAMMILASAMRDHARLFTALAEATA